MSKHKFDVKETTEAIIQWIVDWFETNGKGCNAVIGMSGGKDSTIAAALCVKALGADRVIGVALPSNKQGLNDADLICEFLGMRFLTVPIGQICNELESRVNGSFELSPQAIQNIPPRIRMTCLYAVSQSNNGRVVNTCNLSENYCGYETIFGDSAGDFSPLGNLTVTEILEIGDYLGLPKEWVHKTPDDGLPHSTSDETKLGFTYAALDKYIRGIETPPTEIKEKMDKWHKNSEFKRNPMATFNIF